MIECEREQVSESHLQERLTARATDGWRLIEALVHPFSTEEAAPLFIIFWERVT